MKVNDFMLYLLKELMTKKEITESTATLYIKNLYTLNNKSPFLNLSFLKNVESIDNVLNNYSENTKKTFLSGITSTLSLYKDKPSYKKIYEHYYNKMMAKAGEVAEKNDNVMSKKESENWMTWNDILTIKKDLKLKSEDLFKNSKLLTPQQYGTILSYLILSLYTDMPPRRNQDYMNMYVIHSLKDHDKTKNYLDFTNKKFYFNSYKTAKSYGTQIIDINDELMEAIKIYLSFHPLNPSLKLKLPKNAEFKFLVYDDGSGFNSVNSITRILNKILNKKIGSSMLRHIYLSTKYDIDEMNKDAEQMGHSIEEQKKYMKSPNVV
jgi:hypothetical protein